MRRLRLLPPAQAPAVVARKATMLRRLELEVHRRIDGLASGDHLAGGSGPGTEPAGARRYQPGDDARRIDWNLTARSIVPQVRTTEPDRELDTWVVADRSASLDFGTARAEKRDVALGAVAAFGAHALRGGNRLGVLVCGGEQIERVRPRNGRNALLAALSTLFDSPRREAASGDTAGLAAALHELERTVRRRSRIVVVSDFLDGDAWHRPLARLALRHDVIGAHVTDPREFELPAVGLLTVVDPETGAVLDVQTNSDALRSRYAAAAAERHAGIARAIGDAGARYVWLSTDDDWLVTISRFLRRHRHVAAVRRLR